MSDRLRVFARMTVRRAVATQCLAALLTRAQMHPLRADLHALSALANLRLFHRIDCVEMSTAAISHNYLSRLLFVDANRS